RRYRVVRPDLRGFGRSTPMPAERVWTLDGIGDDLAALLDHLATGPVHLVGAKLGGMIALRFAAARPDRVRTLTVLGAPVSGAALGAAGGSPTQLARIAADGVEAWARAGMDRRLGSAMPAAAKDWWARLMGATPLGTLLGFSRSVAGFDVEPDLPHIAC